ADVEIDASLGIGEACLCHRASFVCTRASVLGNPRLCNGLIAAILIVAWPHVRRTVVPARRAGRVGAQIEHSEPHYAWPHPAGAGRGMGDYGGGEAKRISSFSCPPAARRPRPAFRPPRRPCGPNY